MTEKAKVVTIDHDIVTVTCTTDRCDACSSTSCALTSREFQAQNRTGIPLHADDQVEIYLAPVRAIESSFIALIVPLILFIACYAVASAVGLSSDLVRVAVGFLGVAAGLGLNLLYSRSTRGRVLPEIVRKI